MKSLVFLTALLLLGSYCVVAQGLYAQAPIISAADDGFLKDGMWEDSQSYVDLASGSVAGFRFQIDIGKNSTIQFATLDFSLNSGAGINSFFIYAENSLDAPPLSANLLSRNRIPIRSFWANVDANKTYGTKYTSSELAKLINFLIKQPGWKSGNHVNLFVQSAKRSVGNAFEVVSFDGVINQSQYNGPRLSLKGTGIQYSTTKLVIPEILPITQKPVAQKPITQNPIFENTITPNQTVVSPPLLIPLKECQVPLIPQSPSGKPQIPIVLVIDDIQVDYQEALGKTIVETTIEVGVDLLLNVIPNHIQNSKTILPSLQKWYVDYQCQIEIGVHGFTHQGIEYKMDTLSQAQQQEIIKKGKNSLQNVGLLSKEFTPPGGAENDDTLKVLGRNQFHTNIDWWVGLPNSHGIDVFKAIRLCNLDIGAEIGPDCIFKTLPNLTAEIKSSAKKKGYACVAYHVQDFAKPESNNLDPYKLKQYTEILLGLLATKQYIFMTPEELRNYNKPKIVSPPPTLDPIAQPNI